MDRVEWMDISRLIDLDLVFGRGEIHRLATPMVWPLAEVDNARQVVRRLNR